MKLPLPPISPTKDPANHPLMRGEISRFVWRLYTQRLTKAGRYLILPTVILSAYGGASLQLQGYVVFAYISAIWWVAIAAMLVTRPRVRLTANFAQRVSCGQTLPVDLSITQLSRRGRDLSVLPHRLPDPIDSLPDEGIPLGNLKRNDSTTARLSLLCKRRGSYTLKGFRVESDWPFGILRSRQTLVRDRPLLVYPKFTPLTHLQLPTGRTYQPGGVALASHLGESTEFIGNRDYRQGDNVRDIDWRTTARMTRPIVREYREEYFMRVAVILDTHLPPTHPTPKRPLRSLLTRNQEPGTRNSPPSPTGNQELGTGNSPPVPTRNQELGTRNSPSDLFECAVSMTAAAADFMARQDYLVDLFAAGPNLYHLTAGRSLAYLDQILDILACVDSSPTEPFSKIEPELLENLSRITTVIVVLLDYDHTRRDFVHRLARQGTAVKVIITRDTPPTLDPTPDSQLLGHIPILSKSDCDHGVSTL